jgi:hypothetical protein
VTKRVRRNPANLLHRDRIDTYRAQPLNVFIAAVRIDDVDGLLTGVDAVLDERRQDAVLLVRGVEECAHVMPEPEPSFRDVLAGRARSDRH